MKTAYGIVLVFVMLSTTGCSEGRESKPYSEFTCLEFQNDSEKELFQQSGVIPKGTLISNKEKQVCNNGQFNVVMSENTFTRVLSKNAGLFSANSDGTLWRPIEEFSESSSCDSNEVMDLLTRPNNISDIMRG